MKPSYEPVWPTDEQSLRRRFEQAGFDREECPSGEQANLLLALLSCYRIRGLGPATRPLCEACPSSTECWQSLPFARRMPGGGSPEDGGIMLPWVGANYQVGGALVIAINPNIDADDPTDLLTEHALSWDHHHRVLEDNQRTTFAYRAARSLARLVAYVKHAAACEDHEEDLVDTLHRTARVQAVKCIPKRARSEPSVRMGRDCPDLLLAQELAILQPGVILTLGNIADAAIARLNGYEYLAEVSGEYLWRHRIHGTWGEADVFGIPHPAARSGLWRRGDAALARALSH